MKTKKLFTSIITSLLLVSFFLLLQGGSNIMPPENINLPEIINGWKLEVPPRQITESNIFEYMNGAGELYLGYHFDNLSVHEYRDSGGNTIVVELYQMKDSRDAFGLLSLDWEGEVVELSPPGAGELECPLIPPYRALYAKGLLRAWSDNLFIRIMAYRESPGVRDTILALGRRITAGRENPASPDLLKVIKTTDDSAWKVKRDRTSYFYSHLVLNSFFYLSHENILNLDSSTDALLLTFNREILSLDTDTTDNKKRTSRLLVIRYPGFEKASAALSHFFEAYLPELTLDKKPEEGRETRGFIKIEDGWMGYRLLNNRLALALACPDQPAAFEILNQVVLD